MQHKHVDVVSNEWHYLRLNLPPSKGHKFPITTMPWAVRVYEQIVKRNAKRKLAGPEDYGFMPEYGEKSTDRITSRAELRPRRIRLPQPSLAVHRS
jgi:hypothetical protein